MKVKFPVLINNGANFSAMVELQTEEANKIIMESIKGIPFGENGALASLYSKVKDEAYNQLADSIKSDQAFLNYFLGGKYNFARAKELIQEKFEIEIKYPEF